MGEAGAALVRGGGPFGAGLGALERPFAVTSARAGAALARATGGGTLARGVGFGTGRAGEGALGRGAGASSS